MTRDIYNPNKPADKQILFTVNTRLCDVISDNYALLLIITRYGIPLGFGERTIGQVCQECNVDSTTLLLLLNCSQSQVIRPSLEQLSRIRVESLLDYLSNSHIYFLDYRLPLLRQRLLSAISSCPQEVGFVVRKFYDEYVEEVRKHMNYEDKTVFPYARKLISGERDNSYNISIFSKKHDHIELKIMELKNLLIRYYPGTSSYDLTSVLHDIFVCEADLALHNNIEDNIFIPYITALETGQIKPNH